MAVQKLTQGSRKSLSTNSSSNIGKVDIGIRLKSEIMDIHTVVDIAIVCKSKTKGLYTIWYGNPKDEQNCICDDTINCNGSSWDDDDLRIAIDFDKIPRDIERMSIISSILWGKDLKQHFGMIEKGYLHIYNHGETSDILEQQINWFNHKGKTGLIWVEIYPYKDEWKIRAVEQSVNCKDLGELAQIAGSYL